MIRVREAGMPDHDAIWHMLKPVIRAGETYALPLDMTRADALGFWFSPGHKVYVAVPDGPPLGTYFLRANNKGPGDHVANCGYVTAPEAQGRGIARTMLEHSLDEARRLGFLAMQFNAVVASNARALDTWARAGFEQTGVNRASFRHPTEGLVDTHILYRKL